MERSNRLSHDDRDTLPLAVANAPVSYGVFELTIGTRPHLPSGDAVLDHVVESGYSGIDLGPAGFLAGAEGIAGVLQARGLALAGAYVELPFSEPELLGSALAELEQTLRLFDVLPSQDAPPRPTLADAGSPARRAAPGRAAQDRTLGLTADGWERLAHGVSQAIDLCSSRGYEPTFHPHAGTFVEAEWEVERFLERTDALLCFDSAHLMVGGIDPVEACRAWSGRINHIHLKDVRGAELAEHLRRGISIEQLYGSGVFCPLGHGSVDLESLRELLGRLNRVDWVVVEQDVVPRDAADVRQALRDQLANREFLRDRWSL